MTAPSETLPQSPLPPLIAWYDEEGDGLLNPSPTQGHVVTKLHCVGALFSRPVNGLDKVSCADQPGYMPIKDGLQYLALADIRVAHNGHDYDERVTKRFYPWWKPKGTLIDTLLISRLRFPMIGKQGPNNHLCPPKLRHSHSLKAWGYRLGVHKGDFEGPWDTWTPQMQEYMDQDIAVLKYLFLFLMSKDYRPSPQSSEIEHGFAGIIRRQEAWGFTFDRDAALELANDIQKRQATLEASLVEHYGEWWEPGNRTVIKATRKVKMLGQPDRVHRRWSDKTGKELIPYRGPPEVLYEKGAAYTPIKRVLFQPGSRQHVIKMLKTRHGWKPKRFTEHGQAQVDDDVLRALPWPEAHQLADYYTYLKVGGYVSAGKKAWLLTAKQEPDAWRQHGRVNTIGTYTFRCSHSDPNLGQVPTRHPEFGHKCRALFRCRPPLVLPDRTIKWLLYGFDGSGLQLRLMASYMARWDGGAFAKVVANQDPHEFTQNLIGLDIMGEGLEGRDKGKRINYALPFGAGAYRMGSIANPDATDKVKKDVGTIIKERLADRFGALEELKEALASKVQERGRLVGLDGRIAFHSKPHTALATLLQMAESVVMRLSLILLDGWLQGEGLRPGVGPDGIPRPELADYEFAANIHDEGQADVREEVGPIYERHALACVREAGLRLKVQCPLKSAVKKGITWQETH